MASSKFNIFYLFTFLLLTGCASSSHILSLSPEIVLPKRDPTLQAITISIQSSDNRQGTVLAKTTRSGKLNLFYSNRDPRFLMSEVLEKQMAARGYIIGSNPNILVNISLNKLFAQVDEGNFAHQIHTVGDVTVSVHFKNGSSFTKHYSAENQSKGTLLANNHEISETLNIVLEDIIKNMSKDTEISNRIKNYQRQHNIS